MSKTLEKYTQTSNKNNVNTKTSPVGMINTTSGKGNNNVAIMTKEASEVGDKAKKNSSSNPIHKSIFRPKNNG